MITAEWIDQEIFYEIDGDEDLEALFERVLATA